MKSPSRHATPQSFWLSELGSAHAFNHWVFAEMAPYLGQRIVEVGCGTGTYTELMGRKAQSVVGIDVDPAFVAMAAQRTRDLPRVECREADVVKDSLPYRCDTVVMLDVLEHLPDDRAILARLRDLLEPGGRIVIKVPAHAWLFNPMDEGVGHYRRYGRRQLSAAMSEAGFQVIRIWPFNRIGIVGWWTNGNLLRRTTPPAAQIGGFNRLVPVLRRLERWLPLPIGLSYFAVGRK